MNLNTGASSPDEMTSRAWNVRTVFKDKAKDGQCLILAQKACLSQYKPSDIPLPRFLQGNYIRSYRS